MKKIINGKMYNTETATLIGEWDNGCYGNDFNRCEKSLYKTKKGQFFVAGSGGAMSCYSQSCGTNSVGGGSGMELLTENEAKKWCEEYDIDADIVETYFVTEEG